MPHDFDNTWGIVKDSGLMPFTFTFFLYLIVLMSNVICFFLLQLVFVCITDEQETFIRQVLEISLD